MITEKQIMVHELTLPIEIRSSNGLIMKKTNIKPGNTSEKEASSLVLELKNDLENFIDC